MKPIYPTIGNELLFIIIPDSQTNLNDHIVIATYTITPALVRFNKLSAY